MEASLSQLLVEGYYFVISTTQKQWNYQVLCIESKILENLWLLALLDNCNVL